MKQLRNVIPTLAALTFSLAASDVNAQNRKIPVCIPGEELSTEHVTGTPKCVEVKTAKAHCTTLYEGNGMCLTEKVAETAFDLKEYTPGHCVGAANFKCYDTTGIKDISESIDRNEENIIALDRKTVALENTVNSFMASNEELLRVLGKALQPELIKLDSLKKAYEINCKQGMDPRICATSWSNYEATTNELVITIRENLLETDAEKKLDMLLLIDQVLHQYMKDDIDRTKKMIEDRTPRLSFMGTLGYQILSEGLDHHAFTPGVEACLYVPSEVFGFCLTGNLLVGKTTDGGLGMERNYFSGSTETFTQDHGDYSDVNIVETDVHTSRISYGSFGGTAKFGFFPVENLKLSGLLSANFTVGREFVSTNTKGTSVLSYMGVPETNQPHPVKNLEQTDNLFFELTPQAGVEVCYDFGLNRTCVYGKGGPNIPLGDGKGINPQGDLGLASGFQF
jgi:hypothetical protein